MSWAPAAIGIAGSLIGGLFGGNSAKAAAKTLSKTANAAADRIDNTVDSNQKFVSDATSAGQGGIDAAKNQANDVLGGTLNRQTNNLNPYLQLGQQSAADLMSASGPGGSLTKQFSAPTAEEAAATPGFKFQFDQGNQALQRAAAAGGSLMSGGTLKAASQYGQGLASTYYQNAYNNALTSFQTNRNNTLGTLMAGLGVGQTATSQFDQSQQNAGNLMSGNITNSGRDVAGLGIAGAEYNAGYGLTGAQVSDNYRLQGAGATAQGQIGQSNAWQGALAGITQNGSNLATSLMNGTPTVSQPPSAAYQNNPLLNPNGSYTYGAGPSLPPGYTAPRTNQLSSAVQPWWKSTELMGARA